MSKKAGTTGAAPTSASPGAVAAPSEIDPGTPSAIDVLSMLSAKPAKSPTKTPTKRAPDAESESALAAASRKRNKCSGQKLVVVGGTDDRAQLKSAAFFDGSTGEWKPMPDMTMQRQECAAVSVDGVLYVLAGHDRGAYPKCSESYDTATGEWRSMPHVKVERWGCGAL